MQVRYWFSEVSECSKKYDLSNGVDTKKFCEDVISISGKYQVVEGIPAGEIWDFLESKYDMTQVSYQWFHDAVAQERHRLYKDRMQKRMQNLKCCPFCGGNDLKYESYYFENSGKRCWWIECCVCGGRTRGQKNHDKADEAWNRRN